jgi:hypothetical protein
MTSSHRLDTSVEKPYIEQKEDIEHGGRRRQNSTKHGDRALAIIGDDRISLTEEDVRCMRFYLYSFTTRTIRPSLRRARINKIDCALLTRCSSEQMHPSKDRQSHTCNPGLGLLSANPRQIRPWLCRDIRSPKGHPPYRQSILPRWIHCTHRAISVATILVNPDC